MAVVLRHTVQGCGLGERLEGWGRNGSPRVFKQRGPCLFLERSPPLLISEPRGHCTGRPSVAPLHRFPCSLPDRSPMHSVVVKALSQLNKELSRVENIDPEALSQHELQERCAFLRKVKKGLFKANEYLEKLKKDVADTMELSDTESEANKTVSADEESGEMDEDEVEKDKAPRKRRVTSKERVEDDDMEGNESGGEMDEEGSAAEGQVNKNEGKIAIKVSYRLGGFFSLRDGFEFLCSQSPLCYFVYENQVALKRFGNCFAKVDEDDTAVVTLEGFVDSLLNPKIGSLREQEDAGFKGLYTLYSVNKHSDALVSIY